MSTRKGAIFTIFFRLDFKPPRLLLSAQAAALAALAAWATQAVQPS